MEYFRVRRISEQDFDEVVLEAGGSRLTTPATADYRLNEAVIELKLVQEEGFEKEARRTKIADIFKRVSPNTPVVPILPERLEAEDARAYYNATEGPLKTHVKKAASQLQATAEKISPTPLRVLALINGGYTALSSDEFKRVALKCVHNDTSKIDWLICGGIYSYSDTFDHYLIAPLEGVAVDVSSPFPSLGALQDSWGKHVEKWMTEVIKEGPPTDGRMPVLDLVFEHAGTTFVKPAPLMPKSSFWPSGEKPRDNSSDLEYCPPVAITHPDFTEHDWKLFRSIMPGEAQLKTSYARWKASLDGKDTSLNVLQPFVLVPLTYAAFSSAFDLRIKEPRFADLLQYSAAEFDRRVRMVLEQAEEEKDALIVRPQHLRLEVFEVGQDKANDMCSLHFVSNVPLSSTVGSEAWNSRDLKSRPH